jgi:hypothetical protein
VNHFRLHSKAKLRYFVYIVFSDNGPGQETILPSVPAVADDDSQVSDGDEAPIISRPSSPDLLLDKADRSDIELLSLSNNSIPAPPPVNSVATATVRYEFIPSLPDELSIVTGEVLRMMAEYDDGWALCKNERGEQGMVPLECLDWGDSGASFFDTIFRSPMSEN